MSYALGDPEGRAPYIDGWTPTTSWIPSGSLGIEWTVWRMRRLVADAQRSPLLVETARRIVGDNPRAAGFRNSTEAAEHIRAFLEGGVRFEHDPAGTELLKPPDMMLEEIELNGQAAGDCDDVAVLGAALGRAVGLPARFRLLAFRPGAPYEHVYTELLTDGGWRELDTTKPHQLPSGLRIVRTSTREA
ncbi:MAG: transglutaminase domain-containing protein [Gemmatimonadales bacterium]